MFKNGRLSSFEEKGVTPPADTKIQCERAGRDVYECNNYITSITSLNGTHFETCGTNSLKPKLSTYKFAEAEFEDDPILSDTVSTMPAEKICPRSRGTTSIAARYDGVRYTSVGSTSTRLSADGSSARITMDTNDDRGQLRARQT